MKSSESKMSSGVLRGICRWKKEIDRMIAVVFPAYLACTLAGNFVPGSISMYMDFGYMRGTSQALKRNDVRKGRFNAVNP
ncbi:MAG: hypothetical protein OEZ36_05575 [Spirochaetota bacterium]|nr:hypothetical protein [Spirochaetota bacterium]